MEREHTDWPIYAGLCAQNLQLYTSTKSNAEFWRTVAKQYTNIQGLRRPYQAQTGRGTMMRELEKRRVARDNYHNPNRSRPSDLQITLDRYIDKFLDKIYRLEKQEIEWEQRKLALEAGVLPSRATPDQTRTEERGQKRRRAGDRDGIVLGCVSYSNHH